MNKQAKTWEETVMKSLNFYGLDDVELGIAKVQARLTWEARQKEVEDAEQKLQKVVEFLKGHRHQELLIGAHRFVFTENEWQAFLKDLGV